MRKRPAKRFIPCDIHPGELRLLTWNVGYFTPLKNKNARDVDLDAISGTIQETQSDATILQELGSFKQAEYIAEQLGEGWQAVSIATGHQEQVIAIITNLKPVKTETRNAGGRNMLGCTLEYSDQLKIFILGIHSPHPGRGMQKTRDNIEGALEWMIEKSETVRIMAGDFNYHFKTDTSTVDDQSLYHKLTNHLADSTLAIGETYYAKTRIDHAFHHPKDMLTNNDKSGMIDITFRIAKVPGWRDHRPIVISYNLATSLA